MARYIVPQPRNNERYPDDIDRIVAIFLANGHRVSRAAAEWAWDEYSDSHCAGWLIMSDLSDDEILHICAYRLEAVEEEDTNEA